MIRFHSENDMDFIYNSWINSSKITSGYWRGVPISIYSKEMRLRIDKIIRKPLTSIIIFGDREGLILSYLVYENHKRGNIYHYGYTKGSLRKKGLMKKLIEYSEPSAISIYTASTKKSKKLLGASQTIIFNPFLFLGGK